MCMWGTMTLDEAVHLAMVRQTPGGIVANAHSDRRSLSLSVLRCVRLQIELGNVREDKEEDRSARTCWHTRTERWVYIGDE